MTKMLHVLACACLVILIVGTAAAPDNSAFWLASHINWFEQLRALLLFVLLVQLVTKPPRNVIFRILCGVLSASVSIWALKATYDAQMEILDTMSLLAASVAIGVTALEVGPAITKASAPTKQIPAAL